MNMKITGKSLIFAALPVFLLLITGCTLTIEPVQTPVMTPGGTVPDQAENPLTGTSWQLTAMGETGAELPVVANSMVTLEFSNEHEAGGNGGCNSYGGNYTVEGDSLRFGEIISTLMACGDQAVTLQEQEYLRALQSAERYELNGDQLTIWYDNGQHALIFTPTTAVVSVSVVP